MSIWDSRAEEEFLKWRKARDKWMEARKAEYLQYDVNDDLAQRLAEIDWKIAFTQGVLFKLPGSEERGAES